MKKLLSIFFGIFLSLKLSNCLACNSCASNYKYYVGADIQIKYMRFKKGYGNEDFSSHYPQGNVYAGIRLSDQVGMEFGYKSSVTKIRDVTLLSGDSSCGAIIPLEVSPSLFKAQMKVEGPHLDFVGFIPLDEFPIKIFGSAGVGFLRAKAQRQGICFGEPPVKMGSLRTFKKQKAVLRIASGLEFNISQNFGLRASVCFVNTGRMVIVADEQPARFTPVIRVKNSITYSVGAFFIW